MPPIITIGHKSNRLTALRTMSLRIRGVKSELEKAGLETEGMVESTAKLRELVLASTGVDILEKDQKTFRSTYEILLDISKVWGTMNDELQKSSVLEALAGKLQSNILASILNNGEMLADVYNKAGDSAGSAMKEQERWSQSLEAKASNVEAIFESISTKVFNSDSLKAIYDGLIKIMDTIDKLVGKGKGLQLLAGTIGGVLGGFGNGFINVNTIGGFWKEASAGIAKYNEQAAYGAEFQRSYAISIQGTNAGLSNYLVGLKGAEASLGGYIAHTIKATAASVGLKIATTALNVAINAGIMWLISVGFSALSKWINHNKELAKSFTEATEKIQNSTQTLKDYKESIDKIADSESSETEKLKELNKIKDELADKYGIEIGKINDVAEARRKLNDEIKKQTNYERDLYLAQNKEAYEAAKKQVNDSYDNKGFWNGIWQQMTGQKALLDNGTGRFVMENAKVGKDVQALFDKVTSSSSSYKNKNLDFTLGIDSKDEVEYMKILEKTILEFYSISEDRKLNKDENALYKLLLSQFESLKNNEDAINNIEEYSRTKAERLINIYKQGTMSNKEYLDWLISRAKGDEDVIAALKEIINESDIVGIKFESLGNSSNQILAEILSNYTKIGEATKSVREEIQTADEQFEKLTKTIDDNKDVDKFFSASDIIEILELYPDLNDAVLETAYGYKIEEDALETLRDAKLEEKKIALQTQLDETQGLLNTTKKKLDLYAQELGGIKSVAEAKVKLAELENKLANVAEPQHHRRGERADITAEMAKYKDFIDAAEAADKYQKEIDKLDIELKVLGTDFDKAKDATDAQTDALNTQKDAIKELNDEYKDAKDAIEDLIKLTMDMIKKQKELEKDALKEQLENFKKLIEKRKELISLEKDQYDFERKLKDQNRDLLKIQQELDALSVEGVEYSLEDMKRKAELEEKLTEEEQSRTDFLYDHEVDVRKKALDDELEDFEDQINTKIAAIENFLDKQGLIRQQAIDLINGKSEQFYNDLLDYTLTYTDKSRFELNQLWDSAYAAILKYADGELNVDLALMNLIASMKVADEQLKNIENSINNIKHATDAAKQAMWDYNRVVGDTKAKLDEMGKVPTISVNNGDLKSVDSLMSANDKYANYILKLKGVKPYHTGGIVEGVSTEHGEVLAKLLSGEVVATEGQARQFMEKTLPKLAGTTVNNNNASLAPVINMGDINISGNADQSIVDKLRSVQKDIVNDVFRVINNQKNIYNGGMIR